MISNWQTLTDEQKLKAEQSLKFLKNNKNFIPITKDEFDKNGWTKVKGFVDKNICSLLYNYVKLSAQNLLFYEEYLPKQSFLFGTFLDDQSINNYSRYGDPIFDTILSQKLNDVEWILNKELIPTYSYHRLYTTGTVLERHKDRPSCVISGTMFLGNDISNLENKNYNWPMFVNDNTKGEIAVDLEPGDIIFYKGCEVEHWREKFLGNNHAQVFFHYNEKNKGNDNIYDGRPNLGLCKVNPEKDL